MHRTQIYLSEHDIELLDRAAKRSGASRSELIRRAVRSRYGRADADELRAGLTASFGVWADRDLDGSAYVDSIRSDLNERLRDLGLG